MLDQSYLDDVVLVDEADNIRTCHQLARRGFLFGGSCPPRSAALGSGASVGR